MQEKYCNRCKRTLPITEFHKDKKQEDKHAYYCKECSAAYGKVYRESIKGIYNSIKNRQRYLKRIGDRRAKPFTIPFDEFKELFETNDSCHYCHLPIDDWGKIDDTHIPRTNRLCVDCMDNDAGYVSGNIVLTCYRCNNTKNNFFTYKDFVEIAKTYIKPMWEKQLGYELS